MAGHKNNRTIKSGILYPRKWAAIIYSQTCIFLEKSLSDDMKCFLVCFVGALSAQEDSQLTYCKKCSLGLIQKQCLFHEKYDSWYQCFQFTLSYFWHYFSNIFYDPIIAKLSFLILDRYCHHRSDHYIITLMDVGQTK